MKKLVSVSVVFGVLALLSASASAQLKLNAVPQLQTSGEGIVYNPGEPNPIISRSSIMAVTEKILSPVKTATEYCSSLQFKYAQLLHRNVESLTNVSLFGFIDKWWGTKYRYGGTTKKGIDCSSFSSLLMNTVFGFSLPRTARQQYSVCAKLAREEMKEGDLVFFNTRGGISHVGVYLGDNHFVHSSSSAGVTISSLDENYYKSRFIGAGRPDVLLSCAENM